MPASNHALVVSGHLHARTASGEVTVAGESDVIEVRLSGRRALGPLVGWWRLSSRDERGRRIALAASAANLTGVTLRIVVGFVAAEVAPHRTGGWFSRLLGIPQVRLRLKPSR